ncbi:MAG TPA: amidase family protein [Vicinamibacterales bacterium]|nr:amidase family protein [Vicinamibacterales bacterium]
MANEMWRWDATRIAEAIAKREITSREAVESCLQRMAAVNPKLNAVTVDLGAAALEAADGADAAVHHGRALGPLHGVPISIKENVDQAGCATTNGVVAFREVMAAEDSPVVANLKAAGAVIIGRTNTPAFSFRLDTENELRGRTFSPWSATHTAGGSSGGASSSVAAGMVPLAHGNDIAGSIRFPAYVCGLAGLRPSFGRVPAFNPTATAERSISAQLLSVQGPIARTVRDVRLGLTAMTRHDPRDPWWVPAPLFGEPSATPLRVAVVTEPEDLGGAKLHPTVTKALKQAAAWLADAGYEVVDERTPGFTSALDAWFGMQLPEIRLFMWPYIEKYGDEGIRRAMGLMLESRPAEAGEAYMKALANRAAVVRAWQQFFERVPLVLAPVCTEPVYERGFDLESVERTTRVWRECCTLMAVPVIGCPGLAVPTGVADGLPTGVQILAPRFREDLCLAAGEAIEARSGMTSRVPVEPVW